MKQSGLNIVVEITPGKREELTKVLDYYQQFWFNKKTLPFEALNKIHFCRWIILDELVSSKKSFPERLVFSCNHDGTNQIE